jgi:hypothetical protein
MNIAAPEPWSQRKRVRHVDARIRIDRAEPEEAPALRALHELSLAILSGDAYSPEQVYGLLATRDTAPHSMLEAGRMFVARRHGFMVGSAGWEPHAGDGALVAHVRSVFTHPLQVRQGVASSLIRRGGGRRACAEHPRVYSGGHDERGASLPPVRLW